MFREVKNADLHFGNIMVNSEWKYFSLMSFGLLFWSFFLP